MILPEDPTSDFVRLHMREWMRASLASLDAGDIGRYGWWSANDVGIIAKGGGKTEVRYTFEHGAVKTINVHIGCTRVVKIQCSEFRGCCKIYHLKDGVVIDSKDCEGFEIGELSRRRRKMRRYGYER